MGRKYLRLQIRFYLWGVFILLAGLAVAGLVYLTARDDLSDDVGYEFVGGNVYSTQPRDSKRYVHDIELYGGKAAVVVDDIDRWLGSLWHGKRLAYTLGALAIGLALACFFVAARLLDDLSPDQAEDREG
jgi:hypothetical protein